MRFALIFIRLFVRNENVLFLVQSVKFIKYKFFISLFNFYNSLKLVDVYAMHLLMFCSTYPMLFDGSLSARGGAAIITIEKLVMDILHYVNCV